MKSYRITINTMVWVHADSEEEAWQKYLDDDIYGVTDDDIQIEEDSEEED